MPTDAQISANQANAAHSTGPRTEDGKAASSLNNLRHGFRSQSVLLPGDDPAEYDALLAELNEHFKADDLTELRFIREMADAEWRLRRVREYMESALTRRIATLSTQHPDVGPIELQSRAIETLHAGGGPSYSTWLRYETKYERQYDRAYTGWNRYQKDRRHASATDADILMKRALFRPAPDQQGPSQPAAVKPLTPRLALNVQIPRGASCPCGSGEKYKRCCGRNAPPVLTTPLPDAA
jgi:hypothetical protein